MNSPFPRSGGPTREGAQYVQEVLSAWDRDYVNFVERREGEVRSAPSPRSDQCLMYVEL
jgi:hypothetical protein